MNPARTLFLLLIALLVLCFGLAAGLEPQFQALESSRRQSDNFFSLLLGDSSRIFANSAFVEADAYYHSGYYPTIFDNNSNFQTPHIAEDTGAVASHNQGEEENFLGPPRDWIDAFGRHFIPNRHTHLDEGGPSEDLSGSREVREILPWLKLSAELDPENVKTYVVTAFWLTRMGSRWPRPNRFCATACGAIPTTRNCCLNWAGFILKITTTRRARGTSGRPRCEAGRGRSRAFRNPNGSK